MAPPTIRGVSLFLADVRNCSTSAQEHVRVLQELGKIRQRFLRPKKALTGYEKKKCLVKLVYIHLLGYSVDVGYAEAISLLSSPVYSERAAAYLFCSLLLVNQSAAGGYCSSDLRSLCMNSIKKELSLANEDTAVAALDCASFITEPAAAADIFPLVQAIANPATNAAPFLRQKAYSCMLHCFRLNNALLPAELWSARLGQALLFEQDVSCLLALANLVFAALLQQQRSSSSKSSRTSYWLQLQLSSINSLARIVSRDVPPEAIYHGVPAPWLAIRLLQLLQLFDYPQQLSISSSSGEEEAAALFRQQQQAVVLSLNEIVKKLFAQALANDLQSAEAASGTFKQRFSLSFSAFRSSSISARLASLKPFHKGSSASQQQRNNNEGTAAAAALRRQQQPWSGSTGASVALQRGVTAAADKARSGSSDKQYLDSAAIMKYAVLYEAISLTSCMQAAADEDVKCSAAILLTSLVEEGSSNFRYKSLALMARLATDPTIHRELQKCLPTILKLLDEEDISLRKEATALAFALNDKLNWSIIVKSLLRSLQRADALQQDEVSIEIVLLVEAFAPDASWLVDVVFKMLEVAPQCVRDESWLLVVQVITGTAAASSTSLVGASSSHSNAPKVEPGDPTLQRYAVRRAVQCLEDPELHATTLRFCAYLLGEFGHLIKNEVPGKHQVELLLLHFRRFDSSSGDFPPFTFISTKPEPPSVSVVAVLPLLLLALVKVAHTHAKEKHIVLQLLQQQQDSADMELQTRAVELAALLNFPDRQFVSHTLSLLPPYRRREQVPAAIAAMVAATETTCRISDGALGRNRAQQQPLPRSSPSLLPPCVAAALKRFYSKSSSKGLASIAGFSNALSEAEKRAAAAAEADLAQELRCSAEASKKQQKNVTATLTSKNPSLPFPSSEKSSTAARIGRSRRRRSQNSCKSSHSSSSRSTSGSKRSSRSSFNSSRNTSSSRSHDSSSSRSSRRSSRSSRRVFRVSRRNSSSSRSRSKKKTSSFFVGGRRGGGSGSESAEEERGGVIRSTSSSSSGSSAAEDFCTDGHSSSAAVSPSRTSSSTHNGRATYVEEEEAEEAAQKKTTTAAALAAETRRRQQLQQQRMQVLVTHLRQELLQKSAAAGTTNAAGGLLGLLTTSADLATQLSRQLCLCKEGPLLLIRDVLEVYVRRTFQGCLGELLFHCKNTSNLLTLQLQLQPPEDSAELLVRLESSHSPNKSPLLLTMQPQKTEVLRFRLRCMQPFLQGPPLFCGFKVLQQQQLQLPLRLLLPVTMMDFITPAYTIRDQQLFLRHWQQLLLQHGRNLSDEEKMAAAEHDKEQTVVGPLAMPPQHVPLYLEAAFNFCVIRVGRKLAASGTFETGTVAAAATRSPKRAVPEAKKLISTFCMCTLELKPNTNPPIARLIVRAAHPRVASNASSILSSYFFQRAGIVAAANGLVAPVPQYISNVAATSMPASVPSGIHHVAAIGPAAPVGNTPVALIPSIHHSIAPLTQQQQLLQQQPQMLLQNNAGTLYPFQSLQGSSSLYTPPSSTTSVGGSRAQFS